ADVRLLEFSPPPCAGRSPKFDHIRGICPARARCRGGRCTRPPFRPATTDLSRWERPRRRRTRRLMRTQREQRVGERSGLLGGEQKPAVGGGHALSGGGETETVRLLGTALEA
ncbi:hypothetical protein BRADI_3g07927v3, partial [Brachypodium distachyon]